MTCSPGKHVRASSLLFVSDLQFHEKLRDRTELVGQLAV